jgi:hypothetical protein
VAGALELALRDNHRVTIFLYTETTGFGPARGDAIVELAIVDAAGVELADSLACRSVWLWLEARAQR